MLNVKEVRDSKLSHMSLVVYLPHKRFALRASSVYKTVKKIKTWIKIHNLKWLHLIYIQGEKNEELCNQIITGITLTPY